MTKIKTYIDYINTPLIELENLNIDLYTDEELYNIICFQKQYENEIKNYENIITESTIKFNTLNDILQYYNKQDLFKELNI